jgi:hypothetical protein
VPFAHTGREQSLRHYLAAFGVESPPRVDGEREKSESTLGHVLDKIAGEKPRASIVHVWAPAPAKTDKMVKTITHVRRQHIELRWSLPPFDAGVGGEHERRSPVADAVDEAVRMRARATRARGERLLRRLGVRLVMRGLTPPPPALEGASPGEQTAPSARAPEAAEVERTP